jgi:hypothetical protein
MGAANTPIVGIESSKRRCTHMDLKAVVATGQAKADSPGDIHTPGCGPGHRPCANVVQTGVQQVGQTLHEGVADVVGQPAAGLPLAAQTGLGDGQANLVQK